MHAEPVVGLRIRQRHGHPRPDVGLRDLLTVPFEMLKLSVRRQLELEQSVGRRGHQHQRQDVLIAADSTGRER